jgi:hypothetical protein
VKFRVIAIVVLSFAFTGPIQAQWSGSLSLDNGYDDNMFRNYSAISSASTDASLTLGYFPEHANWAINYSGSVSTFSEFSERLYSTHALGASYIISYGEKSKNNITLVGSGTARLDREDYLLYDYSQALAYASFKHYLTADLPLLLSYRARYRVYPNFGELSYLEHFASLGSMVFFETRTSIRAQVELGYKNYTSSASLDPESTGTSGFTTTSSGLTLDGDGPGGGGGNGGGSSSGGGKGNGEGSGRVGVGSGGNQMGMEATVDYLIYDEPSTSQLSAWVNIGQSLSETTGLSLRLQQRWNLTDRGRAFVGGAVDLIGEEELFDDPYSYESKALTLTLTQTLPWGLKLQSGGFYLLKEYDYPYTLDYTTPDIDLREDTRSGGWFTFSKAIGGNWLMFNGLNLSLGYVYLRNVSNTTYYDFASNAVSLGMRTNF